MTFSVIAYDPESDALGYFWDFGDGTPVTLGGPAATHAYGAPGFYSITVTVVDGPFSSVVSTFQVNVLNQPVVNLGVVPVKRNKAKLWLPLPNGMFRTDRVLSTVKDVKTGVKRLRVRVDKAIVEVSGPGTYRFEVEFLARKTKQLNRTIYVFTVE
jgi:hypothetical protein